MKKTLLSTEHRDLGAKMVDFCGWEMPLYYQGILLEHRIVRENVGIFDISHMGRILITGPDAESFLEYLSTNQLTEKPFGTAIYSVLMTDSGGALDDVVLYKESPEHYFAVVNCVNRQKDLEHFKREAETFRVTIQERYAEEGILAIQGAHAISLVSKVFPNAASLASMHFISLLYDDQPLVLSRTGYTGSEGFEIYASQQSIRALWHLFLKEGIPFGIAPIGLGARDTLRLEMGYALYGHELSEEIAPSESVAAWTIHWEKKAFLGKSALLALEHSPHKRTECGIVLKEPVIARTGHEVFKQREKMGIVTSGAYSPTLNVPIALILIRGDLKRGEEVEVQIRQKYYPAVVVKLPFISRGIV